MKVKYIAFDWLQATWLNRKIRISLGIKIVYMATAKRLWTSSFVSSLSTNINVGNLMQMKPWFQTAEGTFDHVFHPSGMYSTWVWDLVTSHPDFRFRLKSKDFADYVSDTEHLYFSLLGKSSKWPQWKEVYLLWKGIFRRIWKLYMQTIQAMAVIFWRGFWPCTKMADILMSL